MDRRKLSVAAVGLSLAIGGYVASTTWLDTAAASGTLDKPSVEPAVANPLGRGESLVLVIGGVYPTQAKAQAAVAASNTGEFQGYYVAPADDFKVVAAYADVRPNRGSIACTPAGIANSLAALPELSGAAAGQLSGICDELKDSGRASDHVMINLDSRLQRVPLTAGSGGEATIVAPAACDAESRCLGASPEMIARSHGLPLGQWLAVTAFRTRVGAEQFITYVRDSRTGPPAMVLQAVRNGGTANIGLGQEANPDGSGPAAHPLPQQATLQE